MKTLENQLTKADHQDADKQAPPPEFTSKYEAFLGMLNKILSSENIEQKSRLMFENVKGMVGAQVFQVAIKRGIVFTQIDPETERFIEPIKYLKLKNLITEDQINDTRKEGLATLQVLCNELIVRVVSIDGKGREEMIEMVRAMNLMIQEHEHQSDLAKDMLIGRRA
jgi:hypothetical protein